MLNQTSGLQKLDERYLKSLQEKQQLIETKMAEREKERNRAGELLVTHVRKELEMLVDEKAKMDNRNEVTLKEARDYTASFKRFLPELMEAEDKLRRAKLQYLEGLNRFRQ